MALAQPRNHLVRGQGFLHGDSRYRGVAGRLAFDDEGHLFITIGGKASYSQLHELDTPYGKIHRVNDDGSVPKDNPFGNPWRKSPAVYSTPC